MLTIIRRKLLETLWTTLLTSPMVLQYREDVAEVDILPVIEVALQAAHCEEELYPAVVGNSSPFLIVLHWRLHAHSESTGRVSSIWRAHAAFFTEFEHQPESQHIAKNIQWAGARSYPAIEALLAGSMTTGSVARRVAKRRLMDSWQQFTRALKLNVEADRTVILNAVSPCREACAWKGCSCHKTPHPASHYMRRCNGCQTAYYCSVECQTK